MLRPCLCALSLENVGKLLWQIHNGIYVTNNSSKGKGKIVPVLFF